MSYELVPSRSFPQSAIIAYALRDSSLYIYGFSLRDYAAFCDCAGYDPINPQSLAAWRDHLIANTTMSPNTINRMMSAVRRVMAEASRRGIADASLGPAFKDVPGVTTKRLKERLKQHSRTRITSEDMRKLCQAPDTSTLLGKRDAALLATLASSGVRADEAANLCIGDIEKRDGGYVFYVQGKTDIEPRAAYLSVEAKELIEQWLKARPVLSPYVFTSFTTRAAIPQDQPISDTAVWQIVQKYAERCGLQYIKPHDFRRFVGTRLAQQDIRKAQLALGHKNIETTARHYVLDGLEPGLTDHLY